jgi:hypothetical protein
MPAHPLATEPSTRTHDTAVQPHKTDGMRFTRLAMVTGLLLLEAGLAALGVLVHYGVTAEYGDIAASALEEWLWGFRAGPGGIALVVVGIPAVAALVVSSRLWMRLTAVGIPVLMVVGMLVVTPAALQEKLEVQYAATPQCVSGEDGRPGPGSRATWIAAGVGVDRPRRVLRWWWREWCWGLRPGVPLDRGRARAQALSGRAVRCGLAGGRGPGGPPPRRTWRHGLRGGRVRPRWCGVDRQAARRRPDTVRPE